MTIILLSSQGAHDIYAGLGIELGLGEAGHIIKV